MPSIPRGYGLIILVALSAACGNGVGADGGACTLIGCVDQVLIRPLSPSGTLIANVQGTIVVDGETLTVQCAGSAASSAKVNCLPDGVAIQGKPVSMTISLASGDVAVANLVVTPTYVKTQPNGPKCDPICMQGSVDVTLGGGLTDVVSDTGSDGGVSDGGDAGATDGDVAPSCGDAKVCCCDMDAVTAPICSDTGAWQCPKGFGLFTGSDCDFAKCGGPCNAPCPDVAGDAGSTDTAGDSDAGGVDGGDKDTADPDGAGGKCCADSDDCPSGHCIAGVCYQLAELGKGQCWIDGDCPKDSACEGAITCPCGALCFAADKPGTCQETPKPPACTKVDPNAYGPCDMVLGAGWDGGKCVTVSGCSCPAPCSELFSSLDACQKACVQ